MPRRARCSCAGAMRRGCGASRMRSATCSCAAPAAMPRRGRSHSAAISLPCRPAGGAFDGVFGVLAGLEVIRALDEAGVATRAPLELVNWTNEEGSRFRPAMMGSRVFAGDLALKAALAITDDHGTSVAQALRETGQAGPLVPSQRGWRCWLE